MMIYPIWMIVEVIGATVGKVVEVGPHPNGKYIWLAEVDWDDHASPHQIVFGGDHQLTGGELVPVAPPGSRVVVRRPCIGDRCQKMRARRYRGQRSHGMLCSLNELGWISGGPNEVAILRNVTPGQSLDDLPVHRRPEVVAAQERDRMREMVAMESADRVRKLPDLAAGRNWANLW